ncbi:hypothetical protein [Methanoregula sp.]|uniref:hypothetical protein n=1 Tax=Methanoregula sp. TaxID=2052170 RepID=UPI000CB0CC79|nr:hypothetical protein [Methanoregula sp.]PKG31070.1 MAG: hypothetical protein CW742_15320 [Methanoregula sp.]
MTAVEALPFNTDLGYPQKQAVIINGIAYTAYYRWNPEDGGFTVLKIVRNLDAAIVCNTRIENLTPVRAMEPVTMILQVVALPYLITSSSCEVWVVHD